MIPDKLLEFALSLDVEQKIKQNILLSVINAYETGFKDGYTDMIESSMKYSQNTLKKTFPTDNSGDIQHYG